MKFEFEISFGSVLLICVTVLGIAGLNSLQLDAARDAQMELNRAILSNTVHQPSNKLISNAGSDVAGVVHCSTHRSGNRLSSAPSRSATASAAPAPISQFQPSASRFLGWRKESSSRPTFPWPVAVVFSGKGVSPEGLWFAPGRFGVCQSPTRTSRRPLKAVPARFNAIKKTLTPSVLPPVGVSEGSPWEVLHG